MELPVVITGITGLIDAVVEGVTGLVVPPKNPAELAKALEALAGAPDMRRALGRAGAQRVRRDYDAEVINEAVAAEYFRLADLLPRGSK